MAYTVDEARKRIERFILDETQPETGGRLQLESALSTLYLAALQRIEVVSQLNEHPDRARVEIKENAKGEAQISVRLTGDDPSEVSKDALSFYWSTRDQLQDGGIG